jgi:pyruvate dehydrogenase E1 component alpha subunit
MNCPALLPGHWFGNTSHVSSVAADEKHVQLLTADGVRVSHPDYDVEVTGEELRALYRAMVQTRRMDAEGVTLQRQGELALWPSSLGQEAAQIGSARAVRDGDYVFPSYRDHGAALARGVDPLSIFRLYRGVTNGGWDPAERNFHLYTLVIGAQTLHATGYAMGMANDGADGAVIAYFGDGATSQGDVNEAFNFAAVYNAPIVFFCQNNHWAISAPVESQSKAPLYQRSSGFGFPGVRVDGNDVLACLAVTRAALAKARDGGGPTLIEAVTYRMGAHTTSDDPSRYRDPAELEAWAARDPIDRLRAYLTNNDLATADFLAQVDESGEQLALQIRQAVREMPDPRLSEVFTGTYGTEHSVVAEERAWFRDYSASFAD